MNPSPSSSLGAVVFNPNVIGDIGSKFYVAIDPVSSQKAGLRISADTVSWWMQGAQTVTREEWLNELKFELPMALDGFTQWLGVYAPIEDPEQDRRLIWGYGADYDCVLLAAAYKAVMMDAPWGYRDVRCFRTMKSLINAKDVAPPDTLNRHHALIDAEYQARWLQNILFQNKIAL